MIGTPAYVSPEQISGGDLDGRSDLYSFGVTLYYVLTKTYPFDLSGGVQSIFTRLSEDPISLSRYRPEIPAALEAIVMKALARAPEHRYSSALEMKGALEAYLRDEERRLALFSASATALLVPAGADVPATTVSAPAPAGATAVSTSLPPPVPVTDLTTRPRLWPHLLAGSVLLLCAVLGVFSWSLSHWPRGASRPPVAAPAPPPAPAPTAPTPAAAPTPTTERQATARAAPPVETSPAVATRQATRQAELPPQPPVAAGRPVHPPERIPGEDGLPEGLPQGCLGATVDVSFTVGLDGSPRGTKVISRGHEECGPFATRVVAGWKFRPATDVEGRPVPSRPVAAAIQF
jgi:serine/threonine-protein kinase